MKIVITGASRGIGGAIKSCYQENGHSVIGTSTKGAGDLAPLDVSEPSAFSALSAATSDTPVDLLVCNAGIYLDQNEDMATGYDADMWARMMAVNVTGVFQTVQTLLPNLKAAGGKVAIISSQMGSSTQAKGTSLIYRVSKAAALNLGFNLSTALKPEGIAVGIYHPGWVQTDMGGSSADITVEESVAGLMREFDTLSLKTTGCFRTWDGRNHAI